MTEPIGRLELVAFDCADHIAVAGFYQRIVGGEIKRYDGVDDWVELHTDTGVLAFQRVPDHRPPGWPDGDPPQQAHIDIDVVDLDAAELAVVELGASKTDAQPQPTKWRVFLDPAGHPFCLVLIPLP
ncbi:MAG: VOC family protein [Ilumatobacteraceae bacterium]